MAKKDNPAYRNVGTAGQNFFAFYIEDIITNFDRFENDPSFKKDKIDEYFNNQMGFHDDNYGNIVSRVNAVLRIIRNGTVIEALALIDGKSKTVLPESVEKAKDIQKRISSGEIKTP